MPAPFPSRPGPLLHAALELPERRLAVLPGPRELAEGLGTLPAVHRLQPLDILPLHLHALVLRDHISGLLTLVPADLLQEVPLLPKRVDLGEKCVAAPAALLRVPTADAVEVMIMFRVRQDRAQRMTRQY